MAQVHPLYVPPPFQDKAEAGRLILRDGTTATIAVADSGDEDALYEFFKQLSEESRYKRFFSANLPRKQEIAKLCDGSHPSDHLTLIVRRMVEGKLSIIATASYFAMEKGRAEVAFTVDDEFQGKGLGSLLLERLAVLAAQQGFRVIEAITMAGNRAMIAVCRRSGFELKTKHDGSLVVIDLSVIPTQKSVARFEMRDRVSTIASLRPFFYPNAVAVIGASNEPSSIGYRLVEGLVMGHFQGAVYPVNPKGGVIYSMHAYDSLAELPKQVDLAMIAVPQREVLSVVDECAQHGVRALIMITSGFTDAGGQGKVLEEQLVEKVRGYGLRMIGPNSLGLLNSDPNVQLNASFSAASSRLGNVAMASQSGPLGLAILAIARSFHITFSSFVSLGNKADVSSNDLIQHWEEDEATSAILLYLESFGNPRRFARIAQRVSRRKPIVMVKSGRTSAREAVGESQALTSGSRDAAVQALIEQSGLIRAETLDEMFDLAKALSSQPLPHGRRVAVISNARGAVTLCADACVANGLLLPEFSEQIEAELAKLLPQGATLNHSIDMTAFASPEQYRQTISCLLADDAIDALIVIHLPLGMTSPDAIQKAIGEGVAASRHTKERDKPVLLCWMKTDDNRPPLLLVNEDERIPIYHYPEAVGRVLGKMAAYAAWRAKPVGMIPDYSDIRGDEARLLCQAALKARGEGWLTTQEASDVLSAMRLPISPGGIAQTADEAVKLAQKIGFPVVVKLASHQLVHKTEIGCVHLNLKEERAVRQAFEKIEEQLAIKGLDKAMEGVLVQPMIKHGTEVMIRMYEKQDFGSLIAFGLGGIHVEIIQDISLRVTPLTDRDAKKMIRDLRGYRLLKGYRGLPKTDIPVLEECLLRVSRLIELVPEIKKLELNPIFALPEGEGISIADVRIWIS